MEYWYNESEPTEEMKELKEMLIKVQNELGIEVIYKDAPKDRKERERFYDKLCDALVRPYYSISSALRGSPKDYDFGIKRPMLVVYKNGRIVDVYPHQERKKMNGFPQIRRLPRSIIKKLVIEKAKEKITIKEYLGHLLGAND